MIYKNKKKRCDDYMYQNLGYVRVGAIVPKIEIGNVEFNRKEIQKQLKIAEENNISIVITPELSLTGYTCQDLFEQEVLLKEALNQLQILLEETKRLNLVYIVGIPIKFENKLFNCAVVIQKGEILGIVPKTYIPNEGEFYEKRWFSSSKQLKNENIKIFGKQIPIGTNIIFKDNNNSDICFAIEICEDLWGPFPPSIKHTQNGATIIFNLSASNELIGKSNYRKDLIKMQSAKTISAYVYASAGMYESTSDLVFSGNSLITENGKILAENKKFDLESNLIQTDIDIKNIMHERLHQTNYEQEIEKNNYKIINFDLKNNLTELKRKINPDPFLPKNEKEKNETYKEIIQIQAVSLVRRLLYTKSKKTIIGLSGGLDSTLAFLVIVKAYQMLNKDLKDIIAVSMPGFGTSKKTFNNAEKLAKLYGVTYKKIDIKEISTKQMEAIDLKKDELGITYENIQARERTQILMNLANKESGIVIGTGDLSELALGWCTYNGDHMSMYSVNCSVPKTLVKELVKWISLNEDIKKREVLLSIIGTPISPELLPADKGKIVQKTEKIIGDYRLHDFFLYHFLRFGEEPNKIYQLARIAFKTDYTDNVIKETLVIFLKRFFKSQFKRNCVPDGPKIGTIGLSPRGDWRMPSDSQVDIWIKDLENKTTN